MSDVNLDFTVSTSNIGVTVEQNTIEFTPTDYNLSVFTGAISVAGGSSGQLQYNNGGLLGGVPTASFVNGNVTFSNIANLKINGGINGYYLQTDGTGNLTWAAAGGGGNGSPGGSNTQIQFNDNGVFAGNVGFTFNKANGTVSVPGNLNVAGALNANIAAPGNTNEVVFNAGGVFSTNPNLIFTGTVFGTGNIDITANSYTGNGNPLYGINGGNVIGNVASAIVSNTANFAGTVTNANQPNITSVGTLTSLAVTGNITAGNIFANSGVVVASTLTGTLTTNGQPNITSVGTLTDLSVSGTTSLYEAIENVALIGSQSGTYNFNVLDGAIQYSTGNAGANLTLNFRGDVGTAFNTIVANGKSLTATYVMTTGPVGYNIANVQIDSTTQSIKWVNGTTPPLNGNSITAYTFTMIRTSTSPITYTVLGSSTRYA